MNKREGIVAQKPDYGASPPVISKDQIRDWRDQDILYHHWGGGQHISFPFDPRLHTNK